MSTLANIYLRQKRYSDGEEWQNRALETITRILGPSHPALINSLANLALLYVAMKRFSKAETVSRRALAIFEAGGAGESDSANAEVALGEALVGQGSPESRPIQPPDSGRIIAIPSGLHDRYERRAP
jgi:tetratricopeptide (TPR) repeat protein